MPSFLPAKKNHAFVKGSTFRYEFEWKIDNGKTSAPRDLTGWTGKAVLTPSSGEAGSPLTLTTENGGIIFGGPKAEPKTGLIEIYVSAAQLEAVEWRRASYTLFVTEPEGPKDTLPLLSGRFTQSRPPL